MNFPILIFAVDFWQLPKVSTAKFMFPILKRRIRVFVTGQDIMGYDPYPVVRKKSTEPSRIRQSYPNIGSRARNGRELAGNGDGLLLLECAGISPDPTGFCRTSLTWESHKQRNNFNIFKFFSN
jgi:hypothetical protein